MVLKCYSCVARPSQSPFFWIQMLYRRFTCLSSVMFHSKLSGYQKVCIICTHTSLYPRKNSKSINEYRWINKQRKTSVSSHANHKSPISFLFHQLINIFVYIYIPWYIHIILLYYFYYIIIYYTICYILFIYIYYIILYYSILYYIILCYIICYYIIFYLLSKYIYICK